jgi:hypothetical protein
MGIALKGGPLHGKPWPTKVEPDTRRLSTRVGMGETVVYLDTGETNLANDRIFAYQPPKPKPIAESAGNNPEDDDDDE